MEQFIAGISSAGAGLAALLVADAAIMMMQNKCGCAEHSQIDFV
jgi:hypothetical protein